MTAGSAAWLGSKPTASPEMLLTAILIGTLLAGIGSVWLAAVLSFGVLARYTQHMLSLSAGALLATAFMHLLPEAFESQAGAQDLFMTLLGGLVFFFLLDKAELWHHGHEHHHHNQQQGRDAGHNSGHDHGHGHSHGHSHAPVAGTWAVLTGDSVHCFGDGVLIASAFVADLRLGYWLVDQLHDYLPYFLVVASSSFAYVALADLIPQLQKQLSARQTVAQIIWLFTGMGLVTLVSGLAHGH
jgi:zinc and cadmium transporter